MIATFVGLAASLATLLGGLFVLRFTDRLHLILGFSAGAVIAVSLFDLLPEALDLASPRHGASVVTSCAAVGFLIYMVIERVLGVHPIGPTVSHGNSNRSALGASTLSIHSLLDGVAMGVAFQVSNSVGVVVALAVLVHDFSDGINTVNFVIRNGGTTNKAIRWLAVDAAAPLIGVESTLLFSLTGSTLGIALALFSGAFLYIGASDLLPESYHAHPTTLTTVMTLLGVAVLYLAIEFAKNAGAR